MGDSMFQGKWIVFEGLDGSGTTSHSHALFERLWRDNIPVILIKEPSSGVFGLALRQMMETSGAHPLTWLSAFHLDRMNVIEQVIVSPDVFVISDRSWLSTYAYQGVQWPQLKPIIFNYYVRDKGLIPDMVFLLWGEHNKEMDVIADRKEVWSNYGEVCNHLKAEFGTRVFVIYTRDDFNSVSDRIYQLWWGWAYE